VGRASEAFHVDPLLRRVFAAPAIRARMAGEDFRMPLQEIAADAVHDSSAPLPEDVVRHAPGRIRLFRGFPARNARTAGRGSSPRASELGRGAASRRARAVPSRPFRMASATTNSPSRPGP
jgi:hypothetical protein